MAPVTHYPAAHDLGHTTDMGMTGKHQSHTGKTLENLALEVTEVLVATGSDLRIVQGRME